MLIFLFRSISVNLRFIIHTNMYHVLSLLISYLIGAQVYAGQSGSSWKIHQRFQRVPIDPRGE